MIALFKKKLFKAHIKNFFKKESLFKAHKMQTLLKAMNLVSSFFFGLAKGGVGTPPPLYAAMCNTLLFLFFFLLCV